MPDVRFDDGLGALVSTDPWEVVAADLGFVEGPVWLPDRRLLFSDIPNSRIRQWRDGVLAIYRELSGQSNGLTLDPDMRLVSCEHEGRRVSIERDGHVQAVATHYDGKRLNSPNDVVVRSDGRIFFTDPPYGITEDQRELPFNGVFTVAPDGGLTLLATDFDRPNGLALSPDERTLYIADTPRHHVRAFDVTADGALSNSRVFAETREEGRPDGMKVDREGRLYVCATTVQVFAADGRPLGVIDCPQLPANCAWGDDGRTLYITARTAVYRTRFEATGDAPYLRWHAPQA
jgi:sugar lactone lactonase YvrE